MEVNNHVVKKIWRCSIGWWENDGNEEFNETQIPLLSTQFAVGSIVLVDIDDDDLDFVVSSTSRQKVSWIENNGDTTYTEHLLAYNDTAYGEDTTVVAHDVDGDSDLDILALTDAYWEYLNYYDFVWWENDGNFGDGNFTTPHEFVNTLPGEMDLTTGDLDIFVTSSDTTTYSYNYPDVTFWENNGTGQFTEFVISRPFEFAMQSAVGDFDGDGNMDVATVMGEENFICWFDFYLD